jgi:hypothetical protein
VPDLSRVRSGDELVVEVVLDLNGLEPEALEVEFLMGHKNEREDSLHGFAMQRLAPVAANDGGVLFRTTREVVSSGSYRYGIRVRPRRRGPHDRDLVDRAIWA